MAARVEMVPFRTDLFTNRTVSTQRGSVSGERVYQELRITAELTRSLGLPSNESRVIYLVQVRRG